MSLFLARTTGLPPLDVSHRVVESQASFDPITFQSDPKWLRMSPSKILHGICSFLSAAISPVASMAIPAQLSFFTTNLCSSEKSIPRNSNKLGISPLLTHRRFSRKIHSLSLQYNKLGDHSNQTRCNAVIEARKGNPPVMPAVMTPAGPLDLQSVLFRNRIIFIGQPINSQVAQRVISQLVTLATIDEDADILIYLNCPGGSTYSVLAIYDCMSWIKPKVGLVCFGVAASQGALLLAGGEKGMRYAMPNARIMIHQPQSGCGGHVEDVRRQVNEAVQSRQKIDMMFAAFTGQSLEKVQQYTERDRFFSAAEALEFGLIDGVLETEY